MIFFKAGLKFLLCSQGDQGSLEKSLRQGFRIRWLTEQGFLGKTSKATTGTRVQQECDLRPDPQGDSGALTGPWNHHHSRARGKPFGPPYQSLVVDCSHQSRTVFWKRGTVARKKMKYFYLLNMATLSRGQLRAISSQHSQQLGDGWVKGFGQGAKTVSTTICDPEKVQKLSICRMEMAGWSVMSWKARINPHA